MIVLNVLYVVIGCIVLANYLRDYFDRLYLNKIVQHKVFFIREQICSSCAAYCASRAQKALISQVSTDVICKSILSFP